MFEYCERQRWKDDDDEYTITSSDETADQVS